MTSSETTIFTAIKKLFKWLVAILIVSSALIGIIALSIYLFYEIKDKPKIETELKGVAIGEKISDVLFKSDGYKIENATKNENGTFQKNNEISYINQSSRLLVRFENNKVESILYNCSQEYEYTIISKISCGDSSEKIKQRFGDDIRVLCHMNKDLRSNSRVYDAIDYGIRFHLFFNKVEAITIFRPEKLAQLVGINWSKCD
jgi:hypothetical protein